MLDYGWCGRNGAEGADGADGADSAYEVEGMKTGMVSGSVVQTGASAKT